MADKRFLDSYNKIGPSPEAAERIWERLMAEAEGFSPETEVTMRPRSHKKIIRTVLIAAAITALFAVGAYAADFLGMKALFIEGSQEYAQKIVHEDDGTVHWQDNPDGGAISLSQPQAVPEEAEASIQEKIEASKAAWAEWVTWNTENIKDAAVFEAPENADVMDVKENEDGSAELYFYAYVDNAEAGTVRWRDGNYDNTSEWQLIETRTATAEDMAAHKAYNELTIGNVIEGYDFNYKVYNQEMAEVIEEIAAKYGLELRRERTSMYPNTNGFTGPEAYSVEEIIDKLNENVCTGDLFNQPPTDFDKAYFFQEGSFGVSYYTEQASTGEEVMVYLYNSMYSTLSSGYEVTGEEEDISAFTARTFQAQDGTELTILSNGQSAYIYVYLEASFLSAHVWCAGGITDADVDAIANAINYSSIGK